MKTINFFLAITLLTILSSCQDNDPAPVIDIQALTITYSLVSTSTPTTGTVELTGVIKNIGNADYSSTAGQQILSLIQRPAGTTTETVLETKDFLLVQKGAELTIITQIPWDVAHEFQPDLILRVSYDPDLLEDGNTANDDKNSENNEYILAGNLVNDLFE